MTGGGEEVRVGSHSLAVDDGLERTEAMAHAPAMRTSSCPPSPLFPTNAKGWRAAGATADMPSPSTRRRHGPVPLPSPLTTIPGEGGRGEPEIRDAAAIAAAVACCRRRAVKLAQVACHGRRRRRRG